jgi:uncharacterized protein (TIGR02246 family)
MTDTTQQVTRLLEQWADAERRGDDAALAALATDDFVLVGPLGYVLTKEQWANRYRSGDLKNGAFAFKDPQVRDYGDAAVVVGERVQQTTHRGNDASGRFRETLMFVRRDGRWALAGAHLSPMPPAQPA